MDMAINICFPPDPEGCRTFSFAFKKVSHTGCNIHVHLSKVLTAIASVRDLQSRTHFVGFATQIMLFCFLNF